MKNIDEVKEKMKLSIETANKLTRSVSLISDETYAIAVAIIATKIYDEIKN